MVSMRVPNARPSGARPCAAGKLALPCALALALSGVACIDIVGSGFGKYVEREEKRFTPGGRPDVAVSTFDGSIEIRPWDRQDVEVIVEKHAASKEAAAQIDVHAEQNGNRIVVDVKAPKDEGVGLHFHTSRSARLIVSLPAASDVVAKSGDGSIDIERIAGRVELRSGDGSIRGNALDGDVTVHTGDGSIRLDGVKGALNVDTGDGSITVAGTLSAVHARSGDGAVTVRAHEGSAASSDWDITTGDGSVTLELPDGFGGEIDAHTGDGGIRLQDVTLSNVSGDLQAHRSRTNTVRGRLGAGGGTVRVRTGDGAITVRRS